MMQVNIQQRGSGLARWDRTEPTPEEILEYCRDIQDGWDERTERRRQVAQVEPVEFQEVAEGEFFDNLNH